MIVPVDHIFGRAQDKYLQHQNLTRLSTDLNAIDLTIEEAGPSEKKPRLESDDSMKIVLKKLTKVESQLGFLEQLAQAFQKLQ